MSHWIRGSGIRRVQESEISEFDTEIGTLGSVKMLPLQAMIQI